MLAEPVRGERIASLTGGSRAEDRARLLADTPGSRGAAPGFTSLTV